MNRRQENVEHHSVQIEIWSPISLAVKSAVVSYMHKVPKIIACNVVQSRAQFETFSSPPIRSMLSEL